jgi:hypothetical protein
MLQDGFHWSFLLEAARHSFFILTLRCSCGALGVVRGVTVVLVELIELIHIFDTAQKGGYPANEKRKNNMFFPS